MTSAISTGEIRSREDHRTLASSTWRVAVGHVGDSIAGHAIWTEQWMQNRITGTPDNMPGSTFEIETAGALVLIPPSP